MPGRQSWTVTGHIEGRLLGDLSPTWDGIVVVHEMQDL